MSFLEALILGLVQGFTEFLPVSSSGHLMLAEHFLGFENLSELVFFGLVCHLGTLLAIVTIFFDEIKQALSSPKILLTLTVALLPLIPMLFILKPLKTFFDRIDLLGFFFLATAALLFLGVWFGRSRKGEIPVRDSLVIGLFQALAIFPGVSRSGSTISGARLLGVSPEKAVTFSFLLAIPTILGGFALELKSAFNTPSLSLSPLSLGVGFVVSYLTGLLALKVLIRQVQDKNLLPFAWYCLGLGLATLFYFY